MREVSRSTTPQSPHIGNDKIEPKEDLPLFFNTTPPIFQINTTNGDTSTSVGENFAKKQKIEQKSSPQNSNIHEVLFTGEGAINKIKEILTQSALKKFKYIFEPERILLTSNSEEKIKFNILGDGDGSTARLILFYLRHNLIALPEEQIKELAQLLENETKVLNNVSSGSNARNEFVQFQKNPDNYQWLNSIVNNIVINKENTSELKNLRIITIGDNLFDRLSISPDLTLDFLEKTVQCGVISIKGNHDNIIQQGLMHNYQFNGTIEHAKLDKQAGRINQVFVNAVLIENTLITHNGVFLEGNVLKTRVGEAEIPIEIYDSNDIKVKQKWLIDRIIELERKYNEDPDNYYKIDASMKVERILYVNNCTESNPYDILYYSNFNKKPNYDNMCEVSRLFGVNQIFGHSGTAEVKNDEQGNFIKGVNSRNKEDSERCIMPYSVEIKSDK